jgi:hypothetical protein
LLERPSPTTTTTTTLLAFKRVASVFNIMNLLGKKNAPPSTTANPPEVGGDSALRDVVSAPSAANDTDETQQCDSNAEHGLECTSMARITTESEQRQEQTSDNSEIVTENRKNPLMSDPIIRMVSTVLPKLEPLPLPTFVCLFIWCTVP